MIIDNNFEVVSKVAQSNGVLTISGVNFCAYSSGAICVDYSSGAVFTVSQKKIAQ